MPALETDQGIRAFPQTDLEREIAAFLIDRQARGLAPGSLTFYRRKLGTAQRYLQARGVTEVGAITATDLRAMMVDLAKRHNPGGLHGIYRALRTFVYWWQLETEPKDRRNPFRRVRPPRLDDTPLEPVPLDDLRAMLATCKPRTFGGDRDRALLLFLLDSGCRRAECHALNVGHVDLATGSVLIVRGKGGKSRTTFVGAKTRRALVRYLRHRPPVGGDDPLWISERGTRLALSSLQVIVRRRAQRAGVPVPGLHAFRRSFAISALRSGCDLITLQRMLGHSSLAVISRYLLQVDDDLRATHAKVGPVDNLL
jgi:site-specific recombinase XerD